MNWYFVLKFLISGLIVAAVSEISKRSPGFAAIVASLPLTSILAIIWLYNDAQDVKQVIDLSNGIALIVLPSLVFFIALSLLLRYGISFWPSLSLSSISMVIVYLGYVRALAMMGIEI